MHTSHSLSSTEEKKRLPLSGLMNLRQSGGVTPEPTQPPIDTGRRLDNTNITPIQRTPDPSDESNYFDTNYGSDDKNTETKSEAPKTNYFDTNYGSENNSPPQTGGSETNYFDTDYNSKNDTDPKNLKIENNVVEHNQVPVPPSPVQSGNTSTTRNELGFKSLSLLPQYKDEEKKIGWRAATSDYSKRKLNSSDPLIRQAQEKIRDGNETVTNYLDPEQRKKFAVQSQDGLLVNSEDQKIDTLGGRGGFSGTPGTHIFAMGLDGGLHVGDSIKNNDMAFKDHVSNGPLSEMGKRRKEAQELGLQNKTFHHSSFYAGGDIAGAGEIAVNQGRVQFIGDGSGHYHPGGDIMHQTVSHMAKSKDEGGMGLSLMDPRNNKEAVVSLMKKKQGEDGVKMPVSSFLQTGGNEKQIRSKIGMQEELGGLTGPQMEFNPDLSSTRRQDGLSPNTHAFDYDNVEDPNEQNYLESKSILSPSRIKAQVTQESLESRPAFLRNLDQKFGSEHQKKTQERLTALTEAPVFGPHFGPRLGKTLGGTTSETESTGISPGQMQDTEENNYFDNYGSKNKNASEDKKDSGNTNYLMNNYNAEEEDIIPTAQMPDIMEIPELKLPDMEEEPDIMELPELQLPDVEEEEKQKNNSGSNYNNYLIDHNTNY